MLNVSIGDAPAQLRAAVLAMKKADKYVRAGVGQHMRDAMNPVWRTELANRATGGVANQSRILTAGARIANGNPAQLVTASSRRKFGSGGGLVPDRHWAGYEYGANRTSMSTVTSKKGKSFKRHTKRHLPAKSDTGHVIGPTVAEVLPRVAAYWSQSVVRAFMDAAEEGGF